jgi:RHS repeat-associated protein
VAVRTGIEITYTYDSNGNLTQKTEGTDVWGYEWNANNELTRVTKNAVEQARFAYDPVGRRVEKVAGGVTTSYTYDGEDIIEQAQGATVLKYVQGPSADEPLAVDDGAALSFLHADGLGSVVRQSSSAGAVTLTRQYDVWGNLEIGTSTPGYSYTGREWDPEIGLYYYRARYYDPKLGRFISEDPIGPDGGVNFYLYAGNRPSLLSDPLGLYWWYNQASGQLYEINPGAQPVAVGRNGYAGGNQGQNPEGVNNPALQHLQNVGPLPEGHYTIGQAYYHPKLGAVTMNLDPLPSTHMYGRNLMRIHGDNSSQNQSASQGCIVQNRPTRNRINNSLDRLLYVAARNPVWPPPGPRASSWWTDFESAFWSSLAGW